MLKGQLISKRLFGIFKSPKKRTKLGKRVEIDSIFCQTIDVPLLTGLCIKLWYKKELDSSIFAIVIAIFITGVCFNLKTMNYGSVRISKQSNNYSNYSC